MLTPRRTLKLQVFNCVRGGHINVFKCTSQLCMILELFERSCEGAKEHYTF
eukprot:m.583406 g.583406  ORF g.583406 m.583406 type:complete len:51 (+) comp22339_c0_seq1:44-196(+)